MPTEIPEVEIYRGDTTKIATFRIKVGDVYQDVSGSVWTAQWRVTPDSKDFIPFSVDTSNANDGWLRITASASATALMRGDGVWDLQRTYPDNTVETWAYGPTVLTKDVTRA